MLGKGPPGQADQEGVGDDEACPSDDNDCKSAISARSVVASVRVSYIHLQADEFSMGTQDGRSGMYELEL